ncbi:MAG: hypothetical protein LH605_03125 [Microbacteriaceae bacterium]|nr:hypothetical protein [Microbacteriaceae bacterium]
MPEQVEAWWARRQRSKGTIMPYSVGQYREAWQSYPVLVRQYHPDLNRGITLTQIPPAADVYLVWVCIVGHEFVATPEEQRQRPGRSRRRSTWCPNCAALAVTRSPQGAAVALVAGVRDSPADAPETPVRKPKPPAKLGAAKLGAAKLGAAKLCATSTAAGRGIGDAFHSDCAPRPASAAEADLRAKLTERLNFEPGLNAVCVARPFFTHLEVWPDIVLAELRVAIEYDTTGRDGLEHVGRREAVDRRKDRMLRAVGWEVVRIRCGKLQPIGPHDLVASGVTSRLVDRLLDELRSVRGDLIVNCYLAERVSA